MIGGLLQKFSVKLIANNGQSLINMNGDLLQNLFNSFYLINLKYLNKILYYKIFVKYIIIENKEEK